MIAEVVVVINRYAVLFLQAFNRQSKQVNLFQSAKKSC